LLAPTLLGAEVAFGAVTHGAAIAIASAGLFILVVVRMNGLIAQIKQQAAELETLSQHDPLTGAANRRAWDAALPLALDRARADGSRLSVVLLDLDYFKRFNDTYGHQMGRPPARGRSRGVAPAPATGRRPRPLRRRRVRGAAAQRDVGAGV
jgi:predicted signal transduction protein with EAL and GGDEF domain